ncbi:hypothetical protein AC622_03265 [Bacillus sp. FJAT-27916]|uniref:restriction endonuclease n=1 Tax=Bacillus sp. FJAT-27916 TaxID=1679169 RepID=UPI0006A1D528|nr:restriction endonuclease [Bacillus sp. FJAT-27916]KMY43392.1 hypothetical protein AC622_03265 [Bacillus sp. FJAT-27916]
MAIILIVILILTVVLVVSLIYLVVSGINIRAEEERRQIQYEENLRNSGILEVDVMDGRVFEDFLMSILKQRGYNVSETSTTGDYGVDLILYSNEKKIIVQAKRYSSKVGIKAVQEISSAKNFYNADECWVATNNYFTNPAKNLAEANNVTLIDRDDLLEWLMEDNKGPRMKRRENKKPENFYSVMKRLLLNK